MWMLTNAPPGRASTPATAGDGGGVRMTCATIVSRASWSSRARSGSLVIARQTDDTGETAETTETAESAETTHQPLVESPSNVPNAAARYPTTADLSPDTSPESAYFNTTASRAPRRLAARITDTVGPPPHA